MQVIHGTFLPAIRVVMVILCWQISTTSPTGRTTTEGRSMSVPGMGCWDTAPATEQQQGKANFETSNAY